MPRATVRRSGLAAGLPAGLLAAAFLALGGCGDASTEADAPAYDADAVSPIERFVYGADAKAGARRLLDRQAQAIADCMVEKGWEYTPDKVSESDVEDMSFEEEGGELADASYRKRYGYGISTVYDRDGQPSYEMYDDSDDTADETGEDANETYRESLSEEERRQYDLDLTGFDASDFDDLSEDGDLFEDGDLSLDDDPSGDEGTGMDVADPNADAGSDLDTGESTDDGGDEDLFDAEMLKSCQMAGFAGMAENQDVFEELSELDDEVERSIGRDRRIREAEANWAECVAAAGHPKLKNPEKAQDSITDRLSKLEDASVASDAPDLDPEDLAEMDSDELEDLELGDGSISDVTALRKLQRDEIALAADDWECQDRYLLGVRQQVRADAEQRVLDRHRDLFEEAKRVMVGDA